MRLHDGGKAEQRGQAHEDRGGSSIGCTPQRCRSWSPCTVGKRASHLQRVVILSTEVYYAAATAAVPQRCLTPAHSHVAEVCVSRDRSSGRGWAERPWVGAVCSPTTFLQRLARWKEAEGGQLSRGRVPSLGRCSPTAILRQRPRTSRRYAGNENTPPQGSTIPAWLDGLSEGDPSVRDGSPSPDFHHGHDTVVEIRHETRDPRARGSSLSASTTNIPPLPSTKAYEPLLSHPSARSRGRWPARARPWRRSAAVCVSRDTALPPRPTECIPAQRAASNTDCLRPVTMVHGALPPALSNTLRDATVRAPRV